MVTVQLLVIGVLCPAIESLRCVVCDGHISARRDSSVASVGDLFATQCRLLLRVSDAGRSQRCGLHRGRRPKAFNEGTRGKLQAVAPRAPSAMEVCAPRSWVRATDADGCVG